MEDRPIIVPLGGFLGAGKTTLILAAARVLENRGLRAAAVLNDQGHDLVDTQLVDRSGIAADDVTGGCFCCKFTELIAAAERLRKYSPSVIFAEAVGSCTDISATTLQPLKLYYRDQFRVAPYSVLVDPQRAREMQTDLASADVSFLFRTQIEEADLVCFTKTDLYGEFSPMPNIPTRYLSAVTGAGVEAWLDEILFGQITSGQKILDIDYQRYAQAEAALAWLNCGIAVTLESLVSPANLIGPLLDRLDARLTAAGLRIVHLKLSDSSPSGYLKASIIANGSEPSVEGMRDASPAALHELLLNVRAEADPQALQKIVEEQIADLGGAIEIRSMQCFRPAPPKPEHRFAHAADPAEERVPT